ncbi:Negative regulator of sexual conjugation and meiosis [Ceratocystis lukuohia]|uniref:Negative regulator of sexual conjugation and meiosis n=1 Tax=Ceratocystis lukuohia TaxID=2019550 RepID=A0ABR4MJV3_9PEZI
MHHVQQRINSRFHYSAVDAPSVCGNSMPCFRPCSPVDSGYGSCPPANLMSVPPTSNNLLCTPPLPADRIGMILRVPNHDLKLRLLSIIGTGAYGVVYLAQAIGTDKNYAVKVLNKFTAEGQPLDQRQADFQRREIRLHARVQHHPAIVSMYAIIENVDCTYVVMEYCSEGDLFHNIAELGRYEGCNEEARGIFLQLVGAVMYCHERGIFHRDLKPENVLVTNNGQEVKLADFGLATSSAYSGDYGCGSTFYMSPECLDVWSEKKYNCAANDTWGLGVILVNLMCGRNPWKQASSEDSRYRLFLKNPDFLQGILPITPEFNHILGRIFARNPSDRATLPEIFDMVEKCPAFTAVSPPANTKSSSVAAVLTNYPSPPQSVSSEGNEQEEDEDMCDDDQTTYYEAESHVNVPGAEPKLINDHASQRVLTPETAFQAPSSALTPQIAATAAAEPFVSIVNAEYHPTYAAGYTATASPADAQFFPAPVAYNHMQPQQFWGNDAIYQHSLQPLPDFQTKMASLQHAAAYACPITPPPEPQQQLHSYPQQPQPQQQPRSGWVFPLFNFQFSASQISGVGAVPHGGISPLNLLTHHC